MALPTFCQRILPILIIFSTFSSCSVIDGDSTLPPLDGEWEWIRSTGGFGGWTITPDSLGIAERQIIFSRAQSFFHIRADTIAQKGHYSLKKKDTDFYISYDMEKKEGYHLVDQLVELRSKDTLILRDRCADCYRHTYVRQQ